MLSLAVPGAAGTLLWLGAYAHRKETLDAKPTERRSVCRAATGTKDTTYNLVSVLYHALQGAETSRQYIQDTEQAGDQELVQFFRAVQAWQQHLAAQATEVFTQRLSQSDGHAWNPEAKIWNLTIMA